MFGKHVGELSGYPAKITLPTPESYDFYNDVAVYDKGDIKYFVYEYPVLCVVNTENSRIMFGRGIVYQELPFIEDIKEYSSYIAHVFTPISNIWE